MHRWPRSTTTLHTMAKGLKWLPTSDNTMLPLRKMMSSSIGKHSSFLKWAFHESVVQFAARIRTVSSLLESGGEIVKPSVQTTVLMKALPDTYEPLKADFLLYPKNYAQMTLSELERKLVQWAALKAIISLSSMAVAAAVGRGHPTPDKSPTKPHSASTTFLDTNHFLQLRTDRVCICHRTDGHLPEECGQLMGAGYVITHNPEKAAAKRTASRQSKRHKKKSKPPADTNGTPPPTATPATPTPSAPVGGAAHASGNQFAAFESDDSDDGDITRDFGVGALSFASAVRKSNASSTPYSHASNYFIGSSSHIATSSLATSLSSVVVADSGATDHMWPDYSVFTSYKPLTSKHVTLADNNRAPVAGIGSVKILLDGHVIGIRNILHVPSLRVPLYSLRAHRAMTGCGFIGNNEVFHVYFPTFVTTVNDAVDSHIDYKPLGPTSTCPYEFRQARVSGSTASANTLMPTQLPSDIIPFAPNELDSVSVDYDADFPSLPQTNTNTIRPSSPISVVDDIRQPTSTTSISPTPTKTPTRPAPSLSSTPPTPPVLIKTQRRISQEALRAFLPNGATSPPVICSCDTPNGSDTLRHFTSDKIYRLFGNRGFRNYANFCLTSKDSEFINGGEPMPSLGEFTTIPKRSRGMQLPRPRRALEKVHVDIVFGDGLGRLGYRYALLLVDQATRYIWTIGLKSLHADALIAAFSQFRVEAGRLAVQFRTDCDAKLLSQPVVSWLRSHGSDVASAPAGRQSSNGLVEWHWRTMVEMA